MHTFESCLPASPGRVVRFGATWAAVATCVAPASPARAQERDARAPFVLALAGVATSREAPRAAVLWFVASAGADSPDGSTVGRQSVARPSVSTPDERSTWAALEGAAAPDVFVILVRGEPLPPAGFEAATRAVEGTLRESTAAGLTPSAMLARMTRELLARVPALAPGDSGASRLLEPQRLRLTEGDVAKARIGLVVGKHLDFGGAGSTYRVRFEFMRAERFLRAAPPP